MVVVYITFLAFILAFYQFAKPITFFRLNNKWLNKKRLNLALMALGIIPLLEVVAKTFELHLADFASGYYLEILEHTKQAIIVSFYVLTIVVILFLLYVGTSAAKFRMYTAKNFFWGAYHFITANDKKKLGWLADELVENENMESIFNAVIQPTIMLCAKSQK